MNQASYPRDPIVEAIANLAFVPARPWSPALTSELAEAFRSEYPGEQRRFKHINIAVGPSGSEASPLVDRGVVLPTNDGKALVGVDENLLSVHVLAPYPGWTTFLPRIESALKVFARIMGPMTVWRAGLRYIDRIGLPLDKGEGITDYFPCMPTRPASMPEALDGFHVVTQATDPVNQFTAVLRLASVPAQVSGEPLQMLYDLELVRLFDPAVSAADTIQHVDFLHGRQRQIFEDSITERTRSLFR